ncbi:MAG: cytochrome c biogenesis protein CcdA [bacterium]|nr:cytochrome c biogenesis protein CcdA [bacterium]
MGSVSSISAFVAGILTFLAPCTLPLIPAYLGFISGINPEDLSSENTRAQAQKSIILNGAFFVLGFTLVFVALGALAGALGAVLAPYRLLLGRLGGVFIVFLGLIMTGILKIERLNVSKHIQIPSWLVMGNPSSSFAVGATFALGWTPCIGPILGSMLFLASSYTSIAQAVFLLLIFSLGLAIPFLFTAVLYSRATRVIARYGNLLSYIPIIGGIFLILLGALLIFGQFGLTIEYGYLLFNKLNIDFLFDYL